MKEERTTSFKVGGGMIILVTFMACAAYVIGKYIQYGGCT